jgi:hypothetical protein
MNGSRLKAAGFSDREAARYDKLKAAGFSNDEIIAHFEGGSPESNMIPKSGGFWQRLNEGTRQGTQGDERNAPTEGGTP